MKKLLLLVSLLSAAKATNVFRGYNYYSEIPKDVPLWSPVTQQAGNYAFKKDFYYFDVPVQTQTQNTQQVNYNKPAKQETYAVNVQHFPLNTAEEKAHIYVSNSEPNQEYNPVIQLAASVENNPDIFVVKRNNFANSRYIQQSFVHHYSKKPAEIINNNKKTFENLAASVNNKENFSNKEFNKEYLLPKPDSTSEKLGVSQEYLPPNHHQSQILVSQTYLPPTQAAVIVEHSKPKTFLASDITHNGNAYVRNSATTVTKENHHNDKLSVSQKYLPPNHHQSQILVSQTYLPPNQPAVIVEHSKPKTFLASDITHNGNAYVRNSATTVTKENHHNEKLSVSQKYLPPNHHQSQILVSQTYLPPNKPVVIVEHNNPDTTHNESGHVKSSASTDIKGMHHSENFVSQKYLPPNPPAPTATNANHQNNLSESLKYIPPKVVSSPVDNNYATNFLPSGPDVVPGSSYIPPTHRL